MNVVWIVFECTELPEGSQHISLCQKVVIPDKVFSQKTHLTFRLQF